MYRDSSHPSRGRCPSPPPYKSPDEQVWVPPPEPKIDQAAILRCLRGPRAELWGNVGKVQNKTPSSVTPAVNGNNQDKADDQNTKTQESTKAGASGSEYSSFSSFLNSRTSHFGMWQSSKPAAKEKPTWKADPPTFKFGNEEMEEDTKPSEADSQAHGKKRPKEDDEDEWIQSPFCGDRYKKKDVDLLVAFANKYIKNINESTAKRRKMEETDKAEIKGEGNSEKSDER